MTDRDSDVLWGARAIGKAINCSARKTYHLLEAGQLPAKKIGQQWVGSRKKITDHIVGDDSEAA